MRGLVIKNLLQIKHQLKFRDALFVIGLVITTFLIVPQYASQMISAFFLFTISGYTNTIAICDAQTKWAEYEAVLPITVQQRVKAKYFFGIGLLFAAFIIVCVMNALACFILKRPYYFLIQLIIFFFSYLQILCAVPCNIKEDENNGSYIWGAFLVILLAVYGGSKYFGSSLFELLLFFNNKTILYMIVPISLIVGTFISYNIALKNIQHNIC